MRHVRGQRAFLAPGDGRWAMDDGLRTTSGVNHDLLPVGRANRAGPTFAGAKTNQGCYSRVTNDRLPALTEGKHSAARRGQTFSRDPQRSAPEKLVMLVKT